MARLIVELELNAEQINKFQFEAHCADKSMDKLASEVIAVYIKSGDTVTIGKENPCG